MGARRWVFTLLLLIGLLATTVPWRGAALAAERRCFSETGYCLEGRFLEYWEQNGGLPVFGYPISVAAPEINRDTGQVYLTQWFERNRFELHTENARPYDVLLGRLGDDGLRKLYETDWSSLPRGEQQAGCLWFSETQHKVCNQGGGLGFLSYWQSHGLEFDGQPGTSYAESLALFGLPLNEPRIETNTSGDIVLTQWFERARFEWHPDKPREYKVLLGLLGNEVREPVVHPINLGLPGRLAFHLRRLYTPSGEQNGLYSMRGDGTVFQTIAEIEDSLYDITPDGRRVAVQRPGQPGTICLLEPHVSSACLASDTKVSELRLAPDGSQVAYISEGDIPGLHVLSFATGVDRPIVLGHPDAMPARPRWSPDSGTLLYTLQFETEGLYSIAADGSARRQLATFTPSLYEWSPDGQRIFFGGSGGNLWLADALGSSRQSIATSVLTAGWSPSGTHLAYISAEDGQRDLYTVTADGAERRQLTSTAEDEWSLLWSPQSDRIAYGTPDEVLAVGAAGGAPRRMLDRRAAPHAWSPDGRYLAMATLPPCASGHCTAGFSTTIWANKVDHWEPMVMLRGDVNTGSWITIAYWR